MLVTLTSHWHVCLRIGCLPTTDYDFILPVETLLEGADWDQFPNETVQEQCTPTWYMIYAVDREETDYI